MLSFRLYSFFVVILVDSAIDADPNENTTAFADTKLEPLEAFDDPWNVRIYFNAHKFFLNYSLVSTIKVCFGTLYKTHYIITAAECFDSTGRENVTVTVCFCVEKCFHELSEKNMRIIYHTNNGSNDNSIAIWVFECDGIPEIARDSKVTLNLGSFDLDETTYVNSFTVRLRVTEIVSPKNCSSDLKRDLTFCVKTEQYEKFPDFWLIEVGSPMCKTNDAVTQNSSSCELLGVVLSPGLSKDTHAILNIREYENWIDRVTDDPKYACSSINKNK